MSTLNSQPARRAASAGRTRLGAAGPAKAAKATPTRRRETVTRPAGAAGRAPASRAAGRAPAGPRWTVRDKICAVAAGTGAGSVLAVIGLAPLHAPVAAVGAIGAIGSGAGAAISVYFAKR